MVTITIWRVASILASVTKSVIDDAFFIPTNAVIGLLFVSYKFN